MPADINSPKTIERLQALTQGLEAKLAEARRAHVVTINTLATEAIDLQVEYIRALEKHVKELEAELQHYRTWEDSREVAELVEMNKKLEADKKELLQRLNTVILNPPEVRRSSSNPADALLPLICV
jgi:hypothetical protein